MKLQNLTILLCLGMAFTFLFTNCASLTGFQTGRTVGHENGELLISLNASQTPDFDFDENDTTDIENFFFPNIEFSGRYGIAEKFDLGLKINTNFNFALDGRYQIVGDQESTVALAVGAGFGTFGIFSALWNVQIPVYLSFHPSETFSIYFSPRYIAQFSAGDISGSLSYLGGNAGLLFGRRTKFGIDAGYYSIGADGSDVGVATVGFGVKIPFGGK